MDKMKISIAAMVAVVVLFVGIHYATDIGSDNASVFQLPDFKTTEVSTAEQTTISTLKDFNDAIVNIAERTNQTVVTITTTQTVTRRQQTPFSFFFDDPRFDQEQQYRRQGLGSGVIVSEDGYILTNNHVIENADEINVRFFDGDEVNAEVVGTDPSSDIAVLKVEAEDLSAITLGDSENIRVGEMVLAIGSPLGQEFAHSVSMGIVSASGRSSLGLNLYENYIQTDAAINPGNSGGALINLDGELIGINTAIASRTGGYQGIGFAIPINMARDVMESLITEGRVARGYLGIGGSTVDRTMARALGLENARGAIIGEVLPNTPAAEAGLQEGDVILSLDGENVEGYRDFQIAIGSKKPGDEITLGIFRNGEQMEFDVELAERDMEEIAGNNNTNNDRMNDLSETLGFSVDDLTDSIRRQLQLSEDVDGVVVTNISQGSPAASQGLQRGDVITQIGDQTVSNPGEFYEVIQNYVDNETDAVLLRVNRQGRNAFIAIELQ